MKGEEREQKEMKGNERRGKGDERTGQGMNGNEMSGK